MSAFPSWLGEQATSSGVNPNSFGYVAVTGSNTTVTNSLANPNSIILLTPRDTSAAASIPIVNTRGNGSFTVLVALGTSGLTGFNYLILS
jgi:hypothetical protein